MAPRKQQSTAVATQQSQQVTTADERPIKVFEAKLDLAMPTIRPLIPSHVPIERFKSMIITAVAYDEKLLKCTPNSLLRATVEAAELGLSLNKALKEGDILPVWSGKKQCFEAQFRPRYMGLMKLARQSGEIVNIYAHEVYEKDHFDYDYGLEKKLVHKPYRGTGDRGSITHGYVVWQLKDGSKHFEVIDRVRIDRARSASESWKFFQKQVDEGKNPAQNTTWHVDEGEMVRKTAVKAGSKYMPTSSENFARAMDLDTRREMGESVVLNKDGVIEDEQDEDAIDITAPSPSPAAQTQVDRLAQKIATHPVESEDPAPQTDEKNWTQIADRLISEIATLTPVQVTAWSKKNAQLIGDVEFHSPEDGKRIQHAMQGE